MQQSNPPNKRYHDGYSLYESGTLVWCDVGNFAIYGNCPGTEKFDMHGTDLLNHKLAKTDPGLRSVPGLILELAPGEGFYRMLFNEKVDGWVMIEACICPIEDS